MIKCVVYNATYEVLSVIKCEDAVVHIIEGKAVVIEAHPDQEFRSVKEKYPVPLAIRLNYYVKPKRKHRKHATLNRHNLKLRDNHTCQYCGRKEDELGRREKLTRDHIIPESRGGLSTWENLVTACSSCNNRKDNRTPEEAGMTLLSRPVPLSVGDQKRRRKQPHVLRFEFE